MSVVASVPWHTVANNGQLDVIVAGTVVATVPADTPQSDMQATVDRALAQATRAAWKGGLNDTDDAAPDPYTAADIAALDKRIKQLRRDAEAAQWDIESAESDLSDAQARYDEAMEELDECRAELRELTNGGDS